MGANNRRTVSLAHPVKTDSLTFLSEKGLNWPCGACYGKCRVLRSRGDERGEFPREETKGHQSVHPQRLERRALLICVELTDSLARAGARRDSRRRAMKAPNGPTGVCLVVPLEWRRTGRLRRRQSACVGQVARTRSRNTLPNDSRIGAALDCRPMTNAPRSAPIGSTFRAPNGGARKREASV